MLGALVPRPEIGTRPAEPGPPIVQELGPRSVTVSWSTPAQLPPALEYIVRMRVVGSSEWRQVNPDTERLSKSTSRTFLAPCNSCVVKGLQEDAVHEATLEVANVNGWSPPSASSKVVCVYESPLKRARVQSSCPERCAYFRQCIEFVRLLPQEVQAFCNLEDYGICYCNECMNARCDFPQYTRGGRTYALPTGWARIALKAGGLQADALGAFDWHVAYHTTTPQLLPSILGTGRLIRAGDTTAAKGGGTFTVPVRDGHYQNPFWRTNLFTGQPEFFDPKQIFLSPSIRYCELPTYATGASFAAKDGSFKSAHVAFQVRLRPGSYQIGQETVGAQHQIDPHFNNNEIEFYTTGIEHASHILTGLLVRVCPSV